MTDTKKEPAAKHENIEVALSAAQSEMRPPEKNAENPAFKRDGKPMKYADLTSVVESIRAPLTKNGICWGWRSVVFMDQLAMECYLKHGASGTELTCAVPMHLDRQNMHGLKSAYTYAKRIGLESVTGQAPADDDDGNAASETPARAAPKPAAPVPYDPAPHVAKIEAAISGQELIAALDGVQNSHPEIIVARRDKIEQLVKRAPTLAALDKMAVAFAPDWSHMAQAEAARRDELRPRDAADADEIPM